MKILLSLHKMGCTLPFENKFSWLSFAPSWLFIQLIGMRVLLINTSEKTGGAAVAANRLLETLNNNGVKAKLLVADNYPFVIGTNGTDLSYKLTYSSDDETFGYHNSKDWFSFLKAWRRDIEHPVEVTVEK